MLENVINVDKSQLNRALNRIPIIFNKNEEVLIAYDKLFEASNISDAIARGKQMDDVLVTLYKQMCRAAKIDIRDWNDSRITRTFIVR